MARLFPFPFNDSRAMVFVDGENLAIRYGKMLNEQAPPTHVIYKPNVFVWSTSLNNICVHGGVLRKHYYTSVQGDTVSVTEIEENLKSAGIESPQVFKKKKGGRTKRVDISLATDMLLHAARKNYETAVLIAGDEDYIPLVEAVKSEGRRVIIWFLDDGLSPLLKRSADYYSDIGKVLFSAEVGNWR